MPEVKYITDTWYILQTDLERNIHQSEEDQKKEQNYGNRNYRAGYIRAMKQVLRYINEKEEA